MKGIRITPWLIYSCLSLLANLSIDVSAELVVVENVYHLRSSDFDYPNINETLDVIWLFHHSIRLQINEFHLNGHSGDFVLVSELPILNSAELKTMSNISNEDYISLLASSIVTDQGLLLSWKVNKTIEIVTTNSDPRGTFILFHAEAKDPFGTAKFKGLDIEIGNYDDGITTTTSTTPDPRVSPRPGQKIYMTKYLDCKEPKKFMKELDDFKEKIAGLATNYCIESNIPSCLDRGNITAAEVNIPGPNEGQYAGLHYCDPTWVNKDQCVEVTFAITRTDSDGNYVLPLGQLEIMWARKSEELREHGYCPFKPPKDKIDLNTVVWIAFFLGIIVSLTAILGFVRIKNSRVLTNNRGSVSEDPRKLFEQIKEVVPDDKPMKHYDERNPIFGIISMSMARNEPLYPNGDYLRVDDGDETSAGLFPRNSTDNPTFESVDADVYAYENNGYEQEEEPAPLYSRTPLNQRDGNKLFMRSQSRQSATDTEI